MPAATPGALPRVLDAMPHAAQVREGVSPAMLALTKVKHAAWIADFGVAALPLLAALLTMRSVVVVLPVLPHVRSEVNADAVGRFNFLLLVVLWCVVAPQVRSDGVYVLKTKQHPRHTHI